MSNVAPCLSLAVDWHESPMLAGATDGERLAWIILLCHTKATGRGGLVRFRVASVASTYGIGVASIEGMLARAEADGAIERDGDIVTVNNWKVYQKDDKAKPLTPCKTTPTPGFVRFWQVWPSNDRKVNKKGCLAKWHERKLEAKADEIVAGVEGWMKCEQWQEGFIPMPITWLNQERWNEVPEPPAQTKMFEEADERIRRAAERAGVRG